ncbi:MAG TPA: hypothetical protein VGD13_04195 [Xanthobacteraceae bacterium]|jgi:hypothetical protein
MHRRTFLGFTLGAASVAVLAVSTKLHATETVADAVDIKTAGTHTAEAKVASGELPPDEVSSQWGWRRRRWGWRRRYWRPRYVYRRRYFRRRWGW